MAGLVLWNRAEGRPELVEGDKVQEALASGKYSEGAPEVTQGAGAPIVRDASTIGSAEPHGEHVTPIVAAKGQEAHEAQRRAYVDNIGDQALTFGEGIADALSFGLVHDPSATGDLRRDVNSGTALAGQLVGMVIGMGIEGTPTSTVAAFGKKAGRKAAEGILHEIVPGSRAALVARTAEGAGEMAALMGAASVGHQVTDTIMEDKDFSAAAVVHEAGLGAVLGGGFSFLHGVFGRAASRYDIQAQGGLLDPGSDASAGLADHVKGAQDAWAQVLDAHESRMGVLKALQADGILDTAVPEFMGRREIALAEARGALSDLQDLDFNAALDGDPKAWSRWHQTMERAQAKVQLLDDLMTPKQLERMRPTQPGQPITDPGAPVTANLGIPMTDVAEMDARMGNPERAAKYEELYGRPYEKQAQYAPAEGAEALGGEVSPTSELKTPMAKGTPRDVQGTPSLTGKFDVSDSPVEAPLSPKPAVEPWSPSSPAGRFNPAEWTPARVHGELGAGRDILPTEAAKEQDNVLSHAHGDLAKDQHLFPDGYFAPAADMQQNAQAFAKFQERMAVDTPMRPAVSKTPIVGVESGTPVAAPHAVTPVAPAEPTPSTPKAAAMSEGRAAVRRYLDEWYATSDQMGPRFSPGDHAAAQIKRSVDELRGALGGREISAQSTDLGSKLHLPQAQSALGAELNGIYTMRQVAGLAADASKGTAIAGGSKSRFLNWVARRAGGKFGATLLGGALGHAVGGPVGWYVGSAMAYKYMGFAGRAGGAAGRLYVRSLKAAESLLSGNRAAYAARLAAGTRPSGKNPAPNQPVVYSERGPIKDPVARIQDLQRVAASPNTMAEFVAKAAGDLNVVSPEFVAATVAHITAQLTYLASVAPAISYDRLGRPVPPPSGALRRFLEAEHAVFNVGDVVDAVGKGTVTRTQVDALQNAHAAVHARIAAFLLKDPEALAQLERAKLHTIEMVTGVPLTAGADPMFVARQQMGWGPEQLPGDDGSGATQALKIPGAGGPPSDGPASRPLPSQSYGTSGRAPGN